MAQTNTTFSWLVNHSANQCSVLQCTKVQCSAEKCSAVQCNFKVNIGWKVLTMERPKTPGDTQFFSRCRQLWCTVTMLQHTMLPCYWCTVTYCILAGTLYLAVHWVVSVSRNVRQGSGPLGFCNVYWHTKSADIFFIFLFNVLPNLFGD